MAQKKIQTMKKLFFFIILLLILSPISIAKHHLKSPEIAKKNKYKNHKKILNQNQKKDQLYQKEKKASILLASHNMSEVERLCSSVLMMNKGSIIDQGSPVKLIKKHGRRNMEEVFLKLTRDLI